MQTIKRKPVPNLQSQSPIGTQQRVPAPDIVHKIKSSPVSSPTSPPGRSDQDIQVPDPELPRTIVENVDGNDLKAFLARSGRPPVEHQDPNNVAKLGHEVVSSESARRCYFDNASPELPNEPENTSIDNHLSPLSIGQENNTLEGRGYISHNAFKAVSQSSDVQWRAQGESHLRSRGLTTTSNIENAEFASTVYEYTEIAVEAYFNGLSEDTKEVHEVSYLLSEETIGRAVDAHRYLKALTGSFIDEFSPKFVGPISRMLQAWYNRHSEANIYGFCQSPFEVIASDKVLGDENHEVLELLFKKPPYRPRKDSKLSYSHAGCFNYRIQEEGGTTLEWRRLFLLFLWSNCMCLHFFSSGSIEDLVCCWEVLGSYTFDINQGNNQVMKDLRAALIEELTEALPKCWPMKAEAMLKCRNLSAASTALQLAFLNSPPGECKEIQYGVLLENLRRFLEGSWEPAHPFTGDHAEDMHPDFASDNPSSSWNRSDSPKVSLKYRGTHKEQLPNLPGNDKNGIRMATFFRALGFIERPTRLFTGPRDYRLRESTPQFIRAYGFKFKGARFPLRNALYTVDHQFSLYYFNLRSLSQPLLDQYDIFISKRLAAMKGGRYPADMEEVDNLLLYFYPGAEELKRWLATKAYILAMAKEWVRSASLAEMLEYAPLGVNDDYNSVVYLTQALHHFHNKRYSDAEISCYKALQYREIPEFDRDEAYCILSMVARKKGTPREADAHLRRIQLTTNYEALEKKIMYGRIKTQLIEPVRFRNSNNGRGWWLEASQEEVKEAMHSALHNPKLALALFSDISWIERIPSYDPLDPESRYSSYVASCHARPNPKTSESWDPIYFYGNRNRPDVLQIISETYQRETSRDPPAFEDLTSAKELLTQAFRHAAGHTVKFLIKRVQGLDINESFQDILGRKQTRLHGFIGRPPLSPSAETNLQLQDHVPWVVYLKRALTTAHLKEFFDILEELRIHAHVPFGNISILEFAAMNLEWCYDYYIWSPSPTSKHDLILAYYCYSWLSIPFPPELRLDSKVGRILDKVRSGLIGNTDIKLVEYPYVGTEVAPYQPTCHNKSQPTSGSIISETECSNMDINTASPKAGPMTPTYKTDHENSRVHFAKHELQSATLSSSDPNLVAMLDSLNKPAKPPLRAVEHASIENTPQYQHDQQSQRVYPPRKPKFQAFLQSMVSKLE
ncbi:hypothetical protein TWF506_006200 [Arthrobotrys conoides]|uniref:Uncharacterized protein n=1 Tax=Arthrobotrys conoides TaxID=74498 RepID=A0AAN8NRA2_9PEZI